jgi:hypothetical protein
MKIGSKIKPRSGTVRRVTVHERLYVFAPTFDKYGEVHFVSDVTEEAAATTLMRSDHFYHFGPDLEPVSELLRGSNSVPPPPTPAPAPNPAPAPTPAAAPAAGTAGTDEGSGGTPSSGAQALPWNEAVVTEATELLKGSASDISTGVGGVSHNDVVRAALYLEVQSEKPRKNVQALLESTLSGIAASGQV